MKFNRFEDIPIWKESISLVRDINKLINKEKFYRDFSLKDQIKRAIISVSSNIVEGFERRNNNEFIRFLKISKGSCGEVINQLYIALELEYITQEEFNNIHKKLNGLIKQIGGFISYLNEEKKKGNFNKKIF